MTSTDANTVYCPLWRRLFALLYDLLIVIAIVMVVGLVCQGITGGNLVTNDGHARIAWWYQPVQAVMVSAYFLASWLRGGQTIGMRPWHIRVAGEQGGRVTPMQAIVRLLVAAAPLALLTLAPWIGTKAALWCVSCAWLAWLAVAAVDPRKRALHDVIARTVLRR